ncbi:MAG: hypothetical protein K8U57_02090 [Planctomycetes bacterium]|nr:hypothetical protein [Planctomycetota bacterium]
MDDHSLACYRLGLRLRQAVLTQKHADQSSGPGDRDSAKHVLGHLVVAFDEWVRLAGVGVLGQLGAEILTSVGTQLVSAPAHDSIAEPSRLADQFRALESACLEWARTRPSGLALYGAWLRLGLEIASVQYVPARRKIVVDDEPRSQDVAANRAAWRWEHPDALRSLMAQLKVTREMLFCDDETINVEGSFADGLPEISYSPGWAVLEYGLLRLGNQTATSTPATPCHDRDRQFLEWYEAKGEPTDHSAAGIRDRWNGLHPDAKVTREVVVKAIKRARLKREARNG